MEKAQILLEKHDINERSNSSNKLTNQGNGEMTTHTGITNDKMGVCEKFANISKVSEGKPKITSSE